MDVGQRQRAVLGGIFMKSFPIHLVLFLKVSDGFRVFRMSVQIEAGVHAGEAGSVDAAEQLFLRKTAAGAGVPGTNRAGATLGSRRYGTAGGISWLGTGPYGRLTIISHHLQPPRFPENGLFNSGNMVPHCRAFSRS